jgi:hypothetical protein
MTAVTHVTHVMLNRIAVVSSCVWTVFAIASTHFYSFFSAEKNMFRNLAESSFLNVYGGGGTTDKPGPNPTIASCDASVVNFYKSTGSPARFENKKYLFVFEKRCRLTQRWRCCCKFKSL